MVTRLLFKVVLAQCAQSLLNQLKSAALEAETQRFRVQEQTQSLLKRFPEMGRSYLWLLWSFGFLQ